MPYWDERCGVKFTSAVDFGDAFARFWRGVETGSFAPRQMILDKGLTLEAAAQAYVELADKYLLTAELGVPVGQRGLAADRALSPGSRRSTSAAGRTRRAARRSASRTRELERMAAHGAGSQRTSRSG